ncbi:hypothetical protein HK104_004650 [Borealophlyctis nickersoniae]|nr:hypothetical protein HK104_004650 [Borealophlyctis nickersoniae]
MARPLGPGTASQWWVQAEHSIQTREAFIAAFQTHFTPVNTQNTVKERLRALRFVLSLRDYTTNLTKLLSEARAAKSAEFSQDDLKTWLLSGLRRLSNKHGKWIADLTIPASMALHGTSVPGTKFTWSYVTLPEVQEAALSVYQSWGWSDEHPPRQKRKVDVSPAFGKTCDKRERTKPYHRGITSNVVCFFCKEKGYIKRDCPKFKKQRRERVKVNHTDGKREDNKLSSDCLFAAVLVTTHVDDVKDGTNHVTGSGFVETLADSPQQRQTAGDARKTALDAGNSSSRRCAPTELSSTPTGSGECEKRVIASVNATTSRHLTPRLFNGKPEPLIAKHTFVVHGKLNGRFACILIDTGCNTLVVRTGWIAQHKLLQELSHPQTEIEVNWGDDKGTYRSTSLFEEILISGRKKVTK